MSDCVSHTMKRTRFNASEGLWKQNPHELHSPTTAAMKDVRARANLKLLTLAPRQLCDNYKDRVW